MRDVTIVVAGHSRGVGKTTFIERLLSARVWPGAVAVKVSAHRHAPDGVRVPMVEEARAASPLTQTGRYLSAGAERAFLVRAPSPALPRVAEFLNTLRSERRTVIVESNRIVQWLVPDFLFFVVDPAIADWKPSSALCLPMVDAIVVGSRAGNESRRHPRQVAVPGRSSMASVAVDSPARIVGCARF